MGSLENEAPKEKAMWLYPKAKLVGFNPSERWGHSACYSHGVLYVFGGCCGGFHFSDVITLNLDTMAWCILATTGKGPGPRDSHSAVLVGRQMIVFGGTNGSKKVNDIHILDLGTKEWISPECKGTPPLPRESHSATLIGDDKMVIFGGSGEGEATYLNDLHVLDLKNMHWSSPELKGDIPVPRDSHSAVAIGTKLFVYGGDRGDRYYGDVDVLDIITLTWSKLCIQGTSPGVRAGHAAVNIGTKVYLIGGVGDKHYYNDIWTLDPDSCSWTQLDICGQQPQGRFSHTAVVTESDIIIYGGCGDDEHPLKELLVLQFGTEHPDSNYGISSPNLFRNHSITEKGRFPRGTANDLKTLLLGSKQKVEKHVHDLEFVEQKTLLLGSKQKVEKHVHDLELQTKQPFQFCSDAPHPKRKRSTNSKASVVQSEPEEHSISLSQHSSPSQSDQEQNPMRNTASSVANCQGLNLLKQLNQIPRNSQLNEVASRHKGTGYLAPRASHDPQYSHVAHIGRQGTAFPVVKCKPMEAGSIPSLVGAEVEGKVEGAFDSGLLVSATVNGKIYRGILFSPAPGFMSRGTTVAQNTSPLATQWAAVRPVPNPSRMESSKPSWQPATLATAESCQTVRCQPNRPYPEAKSARSFAKESKLRSDLEGLVLSLGGPGNGHLPQS